MKFSKREAALKGSTCVQLETRGLPLWDVEDVAFFLLGIQLCVPFEELSI